MNPNKQCWILYNQSEILSNSSESHLTTFQQFVINGDCRDPYKPVLDPMKPVREPLQTVSDIFLLPCNSFITS